MLYVVEYKGVKYIVIGHSEQNAKMNAIKGLRAGDIILGEALNKELNDKLTVTAMESVELLGGGVLGVYFHP